MSTLGETEDEDNNEFVIENIYNIKKYQVYSSVLNQRDKKRKTTKCVNYKLLLNCYLSSEIISIYYF